MAKTNILGVEHFPILSDQHEHMSIDLEQLEDDYTKMFTEVILPNFNKIIAVSNGHVYHHLQNGFENALFSAALKHTASNQVKAAELLGISRNTLRDRISKYGLY
jgi:DNA-binding protein Fis